MHRAHISWSDQCSIELVRRSFAELSVFTVREIGKVAQFLSGHFFKVVRGILEFDC